MIRNNLIAAIGVALILIGCQRQKQAETTPPQPVAASTATAVTGLEIGNLAPELAFPSPGGKTISLSSLRGKLVLVDFWASWCMPCRMENPNVVRVYNTYKDKEFNGGNGFTVYSVSLDKNMKNWTEAIENDGLAWENHVSDLKFWNSVPAAMYQVTSIPSNFLLNGDGVIIDKDLRGEALGNKLKSLLR